MSNIKKTNAARILDSKNIAHELVAYSVDENDLSAVHVAAQLGEAIDVVFKTLVLQGDRNGVFVCVVPAAAEVDLKKAAKISGNKSCDLVPMKNILGLTGYIRGGCSPIGMKKNYPTYMHTSAMQYKYIYISGGMRGLQIKIAPSDLQNICSITLCDLII